MWIGEGKVGEGKNEEREVGRKGISSAKLDIDERLDGWIIRSCKYTQTIFCVLKTNGKKITWREDNLERG